MNLIVNSIHYYMYVLIFGLQNPLYLNIFVTSAHDLVVNF